MYKGQSITVIIPCLNEEQGIEKVLRAPRVDIHAPRESATFERPFAQNREQLELDCAHQSSGLAKGKREFEDPTRAIVLLITLKTIKGRRNERHHFTWMFAACTTLLQTSYSVLM